MGGHHRAHLPGLLGRLVTVLCAKCSEQGSQSRCSKNHCVVSPFARPPTITCGGCKLIRWRSVLPAGPEVTQPEVDTPLGRVRGWQVAMRGTDRLVNVFLGLPFAQAPLGPGRFSAACPAQSWEGVGDTSNAPAM